MFHSIYMAKCGSKVETGQNEDNPNLLKHQLRSCKYMKCEYEESIPCLFIKKHSSRYVKDCQLPSLCLHTCSRCLQLLSTPPKRFGHFLWHPRPNNNNPSTELRYCDDNHVSVSKISLRRPSRDHRFHR